MSKQRFTEDVRTRVTAAMRKAFRDLSIERNLPEAILQRQALQEFIERNRTSQAATNGKARK